MTLKTFKTAEGQVGKFLESDLQTLDDRYVVGGCEYMFEVLGSHTIDDFIEPVEDPAIIKAQVWEEIKEYREYLKSEGGILFDGHWYHSDQTSKGEFAILMIDVLEHKLNAGDMSEVMKNNNVPLQIKTKSNGFITPKYSDIAGIVNAGKQQVIALHTAAETHHYFLNLSADPANYNYKSSGWPAIYTGV